jgi:hypothetical protein
LIGAALGAAGGPTWLVLSVIVQDEKRRLEGCIWHADASLVTEILIASDGTEIEGHD